jgi:GGDEF domain-containing protein
VAAEALLCHRLLLVAPEARRELLRELIHPPRWNSAEVDSLEQACFVLRVQASDVVVLDGSLVCASSAELLDWLAREVSAPLVVVSEDAHDAVIHLVHRGAIWVPGEAARERPDLFSAILDQAVLRGSQSEQWAADRRALRESQTRIDRLLALLWEAVPGDSATRWFSQHYMLERLEEEVARSRRYGAPLSVVLGELRGGTGERLPTEQTQHLASWLADRVGKAKRRCDVAGQYGLHGFMLLLPESSGEQAREACKRLRNVLTDPPHVGLPTVHACFGLASVSAEVPTVQSLLRRAEERLDASHADSLA